MMSVDELGVDAPFLDGVTLDDVVLDGVVTPFASQAGKIFEEVEKEVEKEPRGGTLLQGPDTNGLGPEKGRLDRLYSQYASNKNENNLTLLLAEVERYARRVTTGRGGAFANYLSQSPTTQYSVSEISSEVTTKVWLNLKNFHGNSKFSVWVFRIARNTVKDMSAAIISRGEVEFHEWKNYAATSDDIRVGRGQAHRGASYGSANDEFEITGGDEVLLPSGNAPSRAKTHDLKDLVDQLKPDDRKIIHLSLDGYTPRELGERFEKNAKWASNQLNRIKKQLKKLAGERYPKVGVAKRGSSTVLVMKGNKNLPASQAAD